MQEFDRVVDRRNTASTKWDRYASDVLPFWVADMDFRTPAFILERLRQRLDHGVLGYTRIPEHLRTSVCDWLARSFGWQTQPEWLVWLPGIVPGLNLACRAVGTPGDHVMVPTPVYYPFLRVAAHGGRRSVEVSMAPNPARGGRWEMDFAAMEAAVTTDTALLLLCNPQNPTGRIFDTVELAQLAEFCNRHELVICSDEIHCSLRLDSEAPHVPIATLSPDIAARSITLMAPNKTYNIPGVGCAFAVIPNASLRRRFLAARGGLVPTPGTFAIEAMLAAYEDRSDWVQRLNRYLAQNRDRLAACASALPGVAMAPVEGTYLAWLDVRRLELDDPGAFFERSGLGLSDGAAFGGAGFVRFNFGCPLATLEQGIERLSSAVRRRAAELGMHE